jgi:hypothetical protein
MPLDFPDSPSVNDQFTVDDSTFIWDGTVWNALSGPGLAGPQGDAATIAVGEVETGTPSTPASVTNVGTSGAAIFDFVIPQGVAGTNGTNGTNGATGPGVAVGGTTGQVLAKSSNTDYATQWVTPNPGITTGKAIAMAIVFG